MKWIEIITLRSADMGKGSTVDQVSRLAAEGKGSDNRERIKIYRHAVLNTDISIHLLHKSRPMEPRPSPLGQQLAAALKEFGLVSHNVWIEEQKNE